MPVRQISRVPSRDRPNEFADDGNACLEDLVGVIDDMNALEQSLQLVATTGTSTSALTIGVGAKALVTQEGKAWADGVFVYVICSTDMTKYMVCQVTDYDADTGDLSVDAKVVQGAGTLNAWTICLAVPSHQASMVEVTPTGRLTQADVQSALQALAERSKYSTGDLVPSFSPTAPPDTVPLDGNTIGSSLSGATSRANNDTAALFALLWGTTTPIQTATGAASTRGASANADFLSNKRIVVPLPSDGAALVIAVTSAVATSTHGAVIGHGHGLAMNAVGDHNHRMPYDIMHDEGPSGTSISGGANYATNNNWYTNSAGGHTPSGTASSFGGTDNLAAGLYMRCYLAL